MAHLKPFQDSDLKPNFGDKSTEKPHTYTTRHTPINPCEPLYPPLIQPGPCKTKTSPTQTETFKKKYLTLNAKPNNLKTAL